MYMLLEKKIKYMVALELCPRTEEEVKKMDRVNILRANANLTKLISSGKGSTNTPKNLLSETNKKGKKHQTLLS